MISLIARPLGSHMVDTQRHRVREQGRLPILRLSLHLCAHGDPHGLHAHWHARALEDRVVRGKADPPGSPDAARSGVCRLHRAVQPEPQSQYGWILPGKLAWMLHDHGDVTRVRAATLHSDKLAPLQVMKIAVAPTVIALDVLLFRRFPKPKIVASVFVVCMGIAVATVTDAQVGPASCCCCLKDGGQVSFSCIVSR